MTPQLTINQEGEYVVKLDDDRVRAFDDGAEALQFLERYSAPEWIILKINDPGGNPEAITDVKHVRSATETISQTYERRVYHDKNGLVIMSTITEHDGRYCARWTWVWIGATSVHESYVHFACMCGGWHGVVTAVDAKNETEPRYYVQRYKS